jgi:hypothetical protein
MQLLNGTAPYGNSNRTSKHRAGNFSIRDKERMRFSLEGTLTTYGRAQVGTAACDDSAKANQAAAQGAERL